MCNTEQTRELPPDYKGPASGSPTGSAGKRIVRHLGRLGFLPEAENRTDRERSRAGHSFIGAIARQGKDAAIGAGAGAGAGLAGAHPSAKIFPRSITQETTTEDKEI